jgi:hypothetical protein
VPLILLIAGLLAKVLAAMGGAAAVAALVPHPGPNAWWGWVVLRRLLDVVAANWLHASNAAAVTGNTATVTKAGAGTALGLLLALALTGGLVACTPPDAIATAYAS